MSAAVTAGGEQGAPQRSPEYVYRRQETQRAERDDRKKEASGDGLELGGVLRQGFALCNPQDCGFRFGDGVRDGQPSL
jgi:hypothetical protein